MQEVQDMQDTQTGTSTLTRARRVGTLIAVVCMLTVTSSRADAPGGFGGPFERGQSPGDSTRTLLENADWLNAETAARVRAAFEDSRPAAEQLRVRLGSERRALHDLLAQDAPDRNVVLQKIEQVGELQIELQKERISTLLTVRALLTPEERAELRTRMSNRGERRFGRVKQACAEDIAQHCADAALGRDTIKCLLKQDRSELTKACSEHFARRSFGSGRRGAGPVPAVPPPAER